MVDAQRALLDQLMGTDRNDSLDDENRQKRKWSDKIVCENFLCGICPNELFINTKMDLGFCGLLHCLKLRAAFESEPEEIRKPVQYRFYRQLKSLIEEVEYKIKEGQKRVDMNKDNEIEFSSNEEKNEKIKTLTAQIDTLLVQLETIGCQGRITDIQEVNEKIAKLQEEKRKILNIESTMRLEIDGRDKRMRVCEICGSFLVINDTMERTENHLEGRQHRGYKKIREVLKELEKIDFSVKRKSVSRRSSSKKNGKKSVTRSKSKKSDDNELKKSRSKRRRSRSRSYRKERRRRRRDYSRERRRRTYERRSYDRGRRRRSRERERNRRY